MSSIAVFRRFLLVLVIAVPFVLAGCEGDEGPMGPQGPEGPEGPQGPPGENGQVFEYSYVGDKGEQCLHCHSTTVNSVMLTGHSSAYTDLDAESQDSPYCLQCHTVGWDRPVAMPGDESWMDAANPDTMGYDDYYGVEGDEAEARRMALAGVQCESCHGPMGPEFNSHQPVVKFGDIGSHDPANITEDDIISLCWPCHSTQFEGPSGDFATGYATSGHASSAGGDLEEFNAEFGRGSCAPCHTAEGFIAAKDPALANYEFDGEYNFIGCVTCHDPHMGQDAGGNVHQLRSLEPQAIQYVDAAYDPEDPPALADHGNGQLCAQCHHARRDTDNVLGQIQDGYAHFGPHGSPQMDMYIGAGCYEIDGYDYEGTFDVAEAGPPTAHFSRYSEDACVACHMLREVQLHGELQGHAFHNFKPSNQASDEGPNCAGCHGAPPDPEDEEFFDFSDGQTEVMALMDDLAGRFGYADHAAFMDAVDDDNAGWTVWQREAAYALVFVYNDGSRGVHNPVYAKSLLNNAIDYYDANSGLAAR